MNEIKIFENEEFGRMRSVNIDGEPWFIGKDIAAALGYAKPENALATHVDKDDKTTTLIQGTGSNYKSKTTVINESGMYALIFGSKLPTAKRFKRWVTSEVLPTLRREGSYTMLDNQNPSILFAEQIRDIASAVAKEIVTTFKTELKEEIKAELRDEPKTRMAVRNNSFSTLAKTPSPTYAIPQVFERLGGDKAKEISQMYGSTELDSLSCIYRRMNALGADFNVIRDRATAINPLTASSVLKQIAVLPAYHDAFFKAAEEILSV